jgi:putative ABC transport system permease protein
MRTLIQDFRLACRALRKQPSFATLLVLTLALGIGANTAIFSVFNAVILKPLPFREPDRLVNLWESGRRGEHYQPGTDSNFITVRPGTLNDWKERSKSFEQMSGYHWTSMMLTGGERAEMVWGHRVAEGFFEMLGVAPQLGRSFSTNDYRPAAPPVVVLSHELWHKRYGADQTLIERTISIDNRPHTVVGVMPAGFFPTRFQGGAQLWIPFVFTGEEKSNRISWGWTILARLHPSITIEQAQSEMDVVGAQMEQAYPEHYQNMGAVLVPADAEMIGSLGTFFNLLMAAAGLVLTIACVNVANLLLVRATEREQEFAVRAALGASRFRILRQLLTESLLVAMLGGTLALVLATVSVRFLIALLPETANIPRLDEVRIDWRAIAFTVAVSFLTAILFSLLPARRATSSKLNDTLKESGRSNAVSRRQRRLGNVLVTGEVALSLVLLLAAALLVQSFVKLLRTDPGFATNHLLTFEVRVPEFRYGKFEIGGRNESRARLFEELEKSLAALPAVQSVAVASKLPVKHGPDPWGITIEGRPAPPPGNEVGGAAAVSKEGLYHHGSVAINRISPAYAQTIGLRLLRGRLFDDHDVTDQPMVALISETTARKYWPNEDPVGQRFTVDYTSWFPKLTAVGVVADIKTDEFDKPAHPEIYWPMAQAPSATARFLVRMQGDSAATSNDVRDAIAKIDRDLPVLEMSTMDGLIADSLWRPRFAAWLLGLFAGLALILAVAGLYGVLTYSVSQRTHELGLRMALGAGPWQVLRLVIIEGMRIVGLGLVVGLMASLALSRVIESQLHGIRATNLLTLLGAIATLTVAALAACYVPARRASKTDPVIALRHE